MTTTIRYAGQTLRTLRYENKADLQRRDPATFEKDRDSVFKEYDDMIAPIAEDWPGTVVYGDVRCPHSATTKRSCFEDLLDALGDDHGKEPAGFIATSSNLFDIELRAKYYFDPIFRCGFGAEPTSRHEENILGAFVPGEPVKQVVVDDIADFFAKMNPEVGEEIRNGDHEPWLEVLLATLDSRTLVKFLDERYA